jgi:hypothetical protein
MTDESPRPASSGYLRKEHSRQKTQQARRQTCMQGWQSFLAHHFCVCCWRARRNLQRREGIQRWRNRKTVQESSTPVCVCVCVQVWAHAEWYSNFPRESGFSFQICRPPKQFKDTVNRWVSLFSSLTQQPHTGCRKLWKALFSRIKITDDVCKSSVFASPAKNPRGLPTIFNCSCQAM